MGLWVIGVSVLAGAAGCSNPSYSPVGMGRGQTMMMPSEIPASNKLNQPAGDKDRSATEGGTVPDAPVDGVRRPDQGGQPQAPPTGDGTTPGSPDRAQL